MSSNLSQSKTGSIWKSRPGAGGFTGHFSAEIFHLIFSRGSAFATTGTREIRHTHHLAFLPDEGVWETGADLKGITPKVYRQRSGGMECHCEMHRSAVGADDKGRSPQDGDESQKIGAIAPILHLVREIGYRAPTIYSYNYDA
jgi:hypothetical protein